MVDTIMQALATHLGVQMFVKNQAGTRPANTVYGEYEVFNTDFANPNQWVRSQSEVANDMIEIVSEGAAQYSIQCNFLYDGEVTATMDDVLNKVIGAWLWFNFDGKQTLSNNNCVVTNISKDIQREYDKEPTLQLMKAGFDFFLKTNVVHTATIEKIASVDYTGTAI